MTTLLMILGAFLIGMGIGLLDPTKPKKTYKPKKKNSKYDWSWRGFLNDPPRDIAHSPSKRYR